MTEIEKNRFEGRATHRPRVHHIYWILAGFDIIAVSLSLFLFARVTGIYDASVAESSLWADRLADLSRLNACVAQMTRPGNQVFDDLSIEDAYRDLNAAVTNFEIMMVEARHALESITETDIRERCREVYEQIDSHAGVVKEHAKEVLDLKARSESDGKLLDEATRGMATMDAKYLEAYTLYEQAAEDIRTRQRQTFEKQKSRTEQLRVFEGVIALLILIMVCGVAVYGQKLARHHRRIDEELSNYRRHLEEVVDERTRELASSSEQLRLVERLASIGTLAAGLGHDMNNVLFPTRCRLDALEVRDLHDGVRNELKAVRRSIDYLQQLAEGLRLLSQDPHGEGSGHETTNLDRWWPEVEALFRTAIPKRIQFHVTWPSGLPDIAVPPHRLTQAIFNLVVNAHEAIPNEGTITLDAEAHGTAVKVRIRDDGEGMTTEARKRALEPFFTTKPRGLSTGLGLTLVNAMTRASGGSIAIDSQTARGTTVTLTLPIASTRQSNKPRALVSIEDARLSGLVSGLLQSEGFDVLSNTPDRVPEMPLWIIDGRESLESLALRCLERGSTRIVAVGASWKHPDLVVTKDAGLQGVRTAILEVARALLGGVA